MRSFGSLLILNCLLLFILLNYVVCDTKSQYSIVMTMIIRDEEVNLRANLLLWTSIIDYFVFLVDTRTNDGTISSIKEILAKTRSKYVVLPNEFDGFGNSRTRSLDAAWKYYSNATHVWISDPDWQPDVKSMNKNIDLDLENDVFGFLSYDRSGLTTRNMHWLLKNRPGLKMRYNLHEVLDIGEYKWKNLNWIIHEIERPGSWHTTVGHGNSTSLKRFLYDIDMLNQDLIEYGHDSHTHYYLGVTHEGIVEELYKQQQFSGISNDLLIYHTELAIKYLELRVTSEYSREYMEDRWGCLMLLGKVYANYIVSLSYISFPYIHSYSLIH